jgi:ribose 5-phosphate isomerase B
MPPRTLITEADILAAVRRGEQVFEHPAGAILTPLARDTAVSKGVALRVREAVAESADTISAGSIARDRIVAGLPRIVAMGCDHRGLALKRALIDALQREGVACVDVGCHTEEAAHYPIHAYAAAVLTAAQRTDAAIVIDGAGIGSAIAANKVRGARAAHCHDLATARNAREHNDANILTLAGDLRLADALAIAHTFLGTPFGGGRHLVRLDLIAQIERITML